MPKRKREHSREKEAEEPQVVVWPYRVYNGFTYACMAVCWAALFPAFGVEKNVLWLDALFLILVTVGTILSLSRQLPWQNVGIVVAVIAFIGGAVHALGVSFGIPFGPFTYLENSGPKILGVLPWLVPFFWVSLVLNARGVSRLVLRPWRKARVYGFRLFGMTVALTILLALAADPFCSTTLDLWHWTKTKIPINWQEAPLINFVSIGALALLMLAFTTPSLIRKQPGQKSGPEYFPLVIWEGLMVWFGIGAAMSGLWTALALDVIVGVAVLFFSIRGARW